MTGTRVYQVHKLHQHIPRAPHNMFGRTLLCIYNDQPINQQKKTKTTDRNGTPTYTISKDGYSTQSENDDENQDSQSPIQKTATKPNQQQIRNQRSTMDIQQTNINTRKARTNATKPEHKIDNPTPALDNNNFPQLPKQTLKKTTNNNRKPQTKNIK